MANSDNTFGVFNKVTYHYAMPEASKADLADVAAAKAYYLSDAALAVFEECGTQVAYQLQNGDASRMTVTIAFGTKGAGTAEADDWAEQFTSRKAALKDSNGWNGTVGNGFHYFVASAEAGWDNADHLF
jgi:hypothetical protein